MCIFQRLVRWLIRRNEGEHSGTWGKDASRGAGGFGSGNPSLVPPSPPCLRPPVWVVCRHEICCLTPAPSVFRQRTTRWCYSTRPSKAGSSSGGKARPSCSRLIGALSSPCPDPFMIRDVSPPTRASSRTPGARRRPRWPRTLPSQRPNGPQRPAWQPPLRPLRKRLTFKMPWGHYK